MASISVIVPSYNQPQTIKLCIESLLSQDFQEDFEIIIVDSSHKEHRNKLHEVASLDRRIRLIKREKQTLPGEDSNIGIKEAKSDIIALIDSDCLARNDWLKNIYNSVKDNQIISGVFENGTSDNILGTCYYLLALSHFFPLKNDPKELYAAATGNFSCKKEVFEQVRYFSGIRAFEDFLFCRKFVELGGKIIQFGDIVVEHVNYTSFDTIKGK